MRPHQIPHRPVHHRGPFSFQEQCSMSDRPDPESLLDQAPEWVRHRKLREWVAEMARLTKPDRVVWCDGSQAEYERLCGELVAAGTFIRLNEQLRPGSYLARSHPSDVAG